jgi:cytochrome c oxidase subunit 3
MKEVKARPKLKPYEYQIQNRFKNYRVMLYFGLASIGTLFLFLSVSYFFNSYLNPDRSRLIISPIFYLSTAIIILSSYFLYIAKAAYLKEDYLALRKRLIIASFLSGLFIISQFFGWMSLNSNNFSIIKHGAASFLFIISGLHALHILGGFIFMMSYTSKSISNLSDEVNALVFFSDIKHKYQIELLNKYWHFLGLVWIYTILFFFLIR